MGVLDFLMQAREAGRGARADLESGIGYYIPPELRGLLGLATEMNPVVGMENAGRDAQRMVAPGMSGWDRMAAAGSMATNMAGVAMPLAGKAGAPLANTLEEVLTGLSRTPTAVGVMDFATNPSGALTLPGRTAAPFDMGRGAPTPSSAPTAASPQPPINRVSTRLPTKGPEATAPMGSLVADTEAFLRNASAPQNMEMMTRTYPGMSRLLSADPVETSENIVNRMKDNVGSLYDLAEAKGITEESSKWYDGANRIANELAQRFDIQPEKSAGVLAVLSPQKDWYQNVGLGERIIKSFREINPQMRWSPEMDNVAMTSAADKDGYTAWMRDKEFETIVRGNSYGAMETPRQKAMWLRAYDEAQNGRYYREVAPNGDLLDYAVKGDGGRRSIVPQSFDNMAKAIRIMEGDGSLDAISLELGEEHKVRNFFNNILTPSSPVDVTADTHQIAGGLLMPYGSSAPEVGHGLSGATAPQKGMPWSKSGSLETGTPGAYGLHFDATKRAADERGWLPRQMQSITWEQLRALMPPGIRGNHPFVQQARDIWGAVDKGEITPEQARAAIIEQASAAGGGGMPTWVGYNGPRRSMLGGGAGLLGVIGGAGLASANEQPERLSPEKEMIRYLQQIEAR